jgi:hypothetical protein
MLPQQKGCARLTVVWLCDKISVGSFFVQGRVSQSRQVLAAWRSGRRSGVRRIVAFKDHIIYYCILY